MPLRGVRGAIGAKANEQEAIYQATRDLIEAMMEANPSLNPDDLASVYFTVTNDLTAAVPAQAARTLKGWQFVPFLCSTEIPVPNSLPRVIRVLLHWNTNLPQNQIRHTYLREAACLHPLIQGEHGASCE